MSTRVKNVEPIITALFDEIAEPVIGRNQLAESSIDATARLTAATLHLMSAYAQCACPKLAVIVEAHIAELAHVAPDACVRAVCVALKNSWAQKGSSCATLGCVAEKFSQSESAGRTLIQKIRRVKFH